MRIVVIDDHPLMLEGIANILRVANHEVVAAYRDARRLMPLLQRQKIDAVTLDIGMPGLNGIDAARQIKLAFPKLKIVFVTQQTDSIYIRSAFAAGASAFVAKQSAGTELLDALHAVAAERRYVTPALIDAREEPGHALGSLLSRKEILTARQREVLQLIAEGKAIKEIAAALHISSKTVEFHKQAIMGSLGLRTTAELTKYAIAQGLVFL